MYYESHESIKTEKEDTGYSRIGLAELLPWINGVASRIPEDKLDKAWITVRDDPKSYTGAKEIVVVWPRDPTPEERRVELERMRETLAATEGYVESLRAELAKADTAPPE